MGNGYISNIDRSHHGIVNNDSDSTAIVGFTIPVSSNLCMQLTKRTRMTHLKKFLNLTRTLISTGI